MRWLLSFPAPMLLKTSWLNHCLSETFHLLNFYASFPSKGIGAEITKKKWQVLSLGGLFLSFFFFFKKSYLTLKFTQLSWTTPWDCGLIRTDQSRKNNQSTYMYNFLHKANCYPDDASLTQRTPQMAFPKRFPSPWNPGANCSRDDPLNCPFFVGQRSTMPLLHPALLQYMSKWKICEKQMESSCMNALTDPVTLLNNIRYSCLMQSWRKKNLLSIRKASDDGRDSTFC